MGFSRQEYWSGLPFFPPGNLPNPGMESASPAFGGGFVTTVPPGKPLLPKNLIGLVHHFKADKEKLHVYLLLETVLLGLRLQAFLSPKKTEKTRTHIV